MTQTAIGIWDSASPGHISMRSAADSVAISDSAFTSVSWASAPVASASASGVFGVANVSYQMSLAPEMHPHDQARTQPLGSVEGLTMGPLGVVVLGYACLGYVRKTWPRRQNE
jgi:hypothetical protein